MATKEGKLFEDDIRKSIPPEVFYYRIKDPAQSFGRDSRFTRFSLKNECDCFLFKRPILVAAELKSNQGTSISLARTKDKKGDIKFSQIQFLTSAQSYGIVCGFLLNFRKTEKTYWIDISNFNRFLESCDKQSINEKDLIDYNSVIVPAEKKKVRYRYDLSFLWE